MSTPPAIPTATVSTDTAALTATITVHAGPKGTYYGPERRYAGIRAAGSAFPLFEPNGSLRNIPVPRAATSHFKVETLLPDGGKVLLTSNLKDGQSVTDYTPPLNKAYRYLVTAYSADGGTTAYVCDCELFGPCGFTAFNFGPNYSKRAMLRLDLEEEWSYNPVGESYMFPGVTGRGGSELPVFYPSAQLEATSTMSGVVLSEDEANLWRSCLRTNSPMVMRTEEGERVPVRVTGSISRSASQYSRWDVSINVEELSRG